MSSTIRSARKSVLLSPNNRLLVLARQGKWLPTWYVAIVISIIITLGSGFGLQLLFERQPLLGLLFIIRQLSRNSDTTASALGELLDMVINYGVRIVLLMAWIKLIEKRPFWSIGLERKGALVQYLRGIGFGMAMYAMATGLMALSQSITISSGSWEQRGVGTLFGLFIVLPGWLLQGASEDLVARGWLLPTMGARYRTWVGIFIATLMFIFFHLPILLSGNILALLSGIAVSLFLAAYALYEGSLWGVIGWHAAWNWTEGNLLAAPVSGHAIAGGSLVNLVTVGPAWMTGGVIGPKASIPVIVVLVIGLLIILALARRRADTHTDVEKLNGFPE